MNLYYSMKIAIRKNLKKNLFHLPELSDKYVTVCK